MPTVTVSADGVSQSVTVAVPTPLASTLWYAKLPDTAALNSNSAAVVTEIVRQSNLLAPVVNINTWTSEPTYVPSNQPLIPGVCSHDSTMSAIATTGIPIPPGLNPTADSDAAILICQPDAPNGGYIWELQGFHWITPGVQWGCNSLSRMSEINSRSTGHFVNWVTGAGGGTPGAVYSTYEQAAWGIQGSGLPYVPGILKLDDILRGSVNHALLLEVYDAAAGGHVWPAARGDGGAGSTNPASVLNEGMWLRLPAGYVIPATLSQNTQRYMQAARDYGLIITDRTLSCLSVRATPSCAGHIDDAHLVGFPWQDLQCLAVGSDSTWHPLAP